MKGSSKKRHSYTHSHMYTQHTLRDTQIHTTHSERHTDQQQEGKSHTQFHTGLTSQGPHFPRNHLLLFYRTDWFEELGVSVPNTWWVLSIVYFCCPSIAVFHTACLACKHNRELQQRLVSITKAGRHAFIVETLDQHYASLPYIACAAT
jgi:hypothetical protein